MGLSRGGESLRSERALLLLSQGRKYAGQLRRERGYVQRGGQHPPQSLVLAAFKTLVDYESEVRGGKLGGYDKDGKPLTPRPSRCSRAMRGHQIRGVRARW